MKGRLTWGSCGGPAGARTRNRRIMRITRGVYTFPRTSAVAGRRRYIVHLRRHAFPDVRFVGNKVGNTGGLRTSGLYFLRLPRSHRDDRAWEVGAWVLLPTGELGLHLLRALRWRPMKPNPDAEVAPSDSGLSSDLGQVRMFLLTLHPALTRLDQPRPCEPRASVPHRIDLPAGWSARRMFRRDCLVASAGH